LKTFLDYAERGAIALPARDLGSLGPTENPFEEAVAEAFRRKGWEVRTQIGVSGFRIDLGIVNPDRAGAYLAGIECDGATYHSSATARDRDKVRQAVLEGLGWDILRVWSTDWFRNPSTVVERLHDKLEKLLAENRAARAEAETALEPVSEASEPRALPAPERQAVEAESQVHPTEPPARTEQPTLLSNKMADSTQPPQTVFDPKVPEADPDRFFDLSYMGELRQIVQEILSREAPITLRSLGREVAHRHGWQRTGHKIMQRVENALGDAELHDEFGVPFVWLAKTNQPRTPFRGMSDRSIQEVSRTEIATILDEIEADLSASVDQIGDLARHMGVGRVTKSARDYLEGVMRWYEGKRQI